MVGASQSFSPCSLAVACSGAGRQLELGLFSPWIFSYSVHQRRARVSLSVFSRNLGFSEEERRAEWGLAGRCVGVCLPGICTHSQMAQSQRASALFSWFLRLEPFSALHVINTCLILSRAPDGLRSQSLCGDRFARELSSMPEQWNASKFQRWGYAVVSDARAAPTQRRACFLRWLLATAPGHLLSDDMRSFSEARLLLCRFQVTYLCELHVWGLWHCPVQLK